MSPTLQRWFSGGVWCGSWRCRCAVRAAGSSLALAASLESKPAADHPGSQGPRGGRHQTSVFGRVLCVPCQRADADASLIKFPVMVEAYRQGPSRQHRSQTRGWTLREETKSRVRAFSGRIFSAGTQITLRDAIRLMIVYSDNTATNLVLDEIGIALGGEDHGAIGLPQ